MPDKGEHLCSTCFTKKDRIAEAILQGGDGEQSSGSESDGFGWMATFSLDPWFPFAVVARFGLCGLNWSIRLFRLSGGELRGREAPYSRPGGAASEGTRRNGWFDSGREDSSAKPWLPGLAGCKGG